MSTANVNSSATVDELAELISGLQTDERNVSNDCVLHVSLQQIQRPFEDQCSILDLQNKARIITCHMGSMAQCRGARGDELRNAGAISAVLDILWRLMLPLHHTNHWIPRLNYTATTEDASHKKSLLPSTSERSIHELFLDTACSNHNELQNDDSLADATGSDALHLAALELANLCLGALRDLACGSALSRSAILDWQPPYTVKFEYSCNGNQLLEIKNGINLLCAYVLRYHELNWVDILNLPMCSGTSKNDTKADIPITERGKKELRLFTNTLGAVRNASHSTPYNCQAFFESGLTNLLTWRLSLDLNALDEKANISITSTMSDSSRYWREAKYRAAGSLINLAEKCPSVAYQLGSDRQMILLLIETWGGANAISSDPKKLKCIPLLHLGLAAILHAADDGALEGGLDDVMKRILEKETIRKKMAQKKEEEKKNRLKHGT